MVLAQDPDALAGLDPDRVATFAAANRAHVMSAVEDHLAAVVSWCVQAAPIPAWSAAVFGDDENATERLWEGILGACRVDTDDPVAAWHVHQSGLAARRDHLTARHHTALR